MRLLLHGSILFQTSIRFQIHFQVNRILVEGAICHISQMVFVERIIAFPAHQLCHPAAFQIEQIPVKRIALFDQRHIIFIGRFEHIGEPITFLRRNMRNAINNRVTYSRLVITDAVRSIGMQHVSHHRFLMAQRVYAGRDIGMDVSFIYQKAFQFICRLLDQHRVQDNRGFTHSTKLFVHPRLVVLTRPIIKV